MSGRTDEEPAGQRHSYAAAGRTVMPSVVHVTDQDANTRAVVEWDAVTCAC